MKKAFGDRLSHGRGSVNTCKHAVAILSRAREQAVYCLFQHPVSLGENRRRTSMERTVMRRSGGGVLSRVAQFANARGRQRQTNGPRSQPWPVQLQLRKLRGRPRFDPYRGDHRRGHAGLRAGRKAGLKGEQQQERQADTDSQRPRETSPPTHQVELIRISGVGSSASGTSAKGNNERPSHRLGTFLAYGLNRFPPACAS